MKEATGLDARAPGPVSLCDQRITIKTKLQLETENTTTYMVEIVSGMAISCQLFARFPVRFARQGPEIHGFTGLTPLLNGRLPSASTQLTHRFPNQPRGEYGICKDTSDVLRTQGTCCDCEVLRIRPLL
jgi:hypothetical protein